MGSKHGYNSNKLFQSEQDFFPTRHISVRQLRKYKSKPEILDFFFPGPAFGLVVALG